MTSKIDIYNMALRNIGSSERVESVGERSKPARVCSDFYDHCVDYVLGDAYWQFATRAIALAESSETYLGWDKVYEQPNGCLFVRAVTDSAGVRLFARSIITCDADFRSLYPVRIPYQIISNTNLDARLIVTDLTPAYAIYTARVPTPNVWGAQFIAALSAYLAAKIGPAMQVDFSVVQSMFQLYSLEKSKAMANDLNEQRSDPEPESPSIAIRG